MTRARRDQVSLESTPYYHCICRCVRRAFLCGEDSQSGHNYDHRKQWLVDRIKFLASIFSIDISAYAVMSNHYHLVVRIDGVRATEWCDDEVIDRWYQLFNGHVIVDRYLSGKSLTSAELRVVDECVQLWRERLYDLGWFMRCLNEPIARQANEEDDCKGRFWEGRYKSQALLDEAALLSCMAYVDLNLIRAGVSNSPETSDFTSIQERLKAAADRRRLDPCISRFQRGKQLQPAELPIRRNDYFELVDWTGRAIRDDKRGHIPDHLANILVRLEIEPAHWLDTVKLIETRFSRAIGMPVAMEAYSRQLSQCWIRGMGPSRRYFSLCPVVDHRGVDGQGAIK
ncbi:transposase [Pseudomonadota bacterium]